MATFPSTLEQYITVTYDSYENSKQTQFDYGARHRHALKTDYTMAVTLKVDGTELNTFETFYFEDIDGGVENFLSNGLQMGEVNVESFRMINAPTVSALGNDNYVINFNVTPTNETLRYNSIQNCPNVPLIIQVPNSGLYPCS